MGLNQEITSFVNSITIISDISFFNSPNWQSVSEFICKPLLTMDEGGEQYVFRNVWKLKRSNETLINYFDQNFPLSKDLADQMIENKKKAEVTIYIDDSGNLKDIFYKKTGIQELDSLVLNFFNTLPQLEISSILQHRLSKGYKIQIGGVWLCETDYDPKFNQKFEEKYAAFKDQAITQIDQSELNYYVLAASSFGWINCDRFYQSAEKKVDYAVNVKDKIGDMKIVIVFKEMNSIMQGYQQDGRTKFAKVPINQPIKIIGISYENEKPMLAISETITSEQGFELTDFKEFTLDELKSQLGN